MIKAVGKRLVVKELEPVEEKKTILIIPHKKEQVIAEVIAIGSEVDSNVELHDWVYLPDNTGVPFQCEGEVYLSINENQVLAAYKDK